jgi:hypothetical protein
MRVLLLALFVASSTAHAEPLAPPPQPPLTPLPPGPEPKPPKKWTVMVTITETVSSQCGGARYRPELDERHVAVGYTYLVRRGKKHAPGKVIAKASSDAAGHLYFNLPKGTYCLITPAKQDVSAKKKPGDTALSNEEQKECDLVVVAPTKTASIDLHRSTCPPLPPGTSPPP